jgi:hypothetical protein
MNDRECDRGALANTPFGWAAQEMKARFSECERQLGALVRLDPEARAAALAASIPYAALPACGVT